MTVLRKFDYDNFSVEIVALPCSDVTFVGGTEDPLDILTRLAKGYEGIYDPNFVPTQIDVEKALEDMNSTKLQTPLENISTVWLLNGVSRGFTHQLVRTRVGASFVQESMRFLGHKGVYQVLALGEIVRNEKFLRIYSDAAAHGVRSYEELISLGASSEDARGALPTNILTSVYVGYAMSTLRTVYTQRMCCQAQPGEWQHILREMKVLLIKKYGEDMKTMLSAPYERGESCGYRASFDRPCIWQKS